jgi:hypothetical protein
MIDREYLGTYYVSRYTQLGLGDIFMPLKINGDIYYRTAEVCQQAGISRNTLLRWVKTGVVSEAGQRDWRGWRLFSEEELSNIVGLTTYINRVE